MCGLAGIAKLNQGFIASELLTSLSQALHHRGPDDAGFLGLNYSNHTIDNNKNPQALSNANLAFVHTRLAIQDLSPNAAQPMISQDKTTAIVFNGEIYNFFELKNKLIKVGYNFKTECDTEVLLAAYQHYGSNVFSHLIGMYAFAILDLNKQEVILGRDNFGMKPLYIYKSKEYIAFASEIKALLKLPFIKPEINHQALYEYLSLGTCDFKDKTFYKNIVPLPAAHYVKFDLNSLNLSGYMRHWIVDFEDTLDISQIEANRTLESLFMQSIELHQRSSVPIGAALSGGIDSSLIVSSIVKKQYQIH